MSLPARRPPGGPGPRPLRGSPGRIVSGRNHVVSATRTAYARAVLGPSHGEILALLPDEREALVVLLQDLAPEEWSAKTACAGWSVQDIAAHVLGDDVGLIAAWRDGYEDREAAPATWDELVALVNARNDAWVSAWRRASPRLIVEALEWSWPPLWEVLQAVDPEQLGSPVSWAGDRPARNGLHVAREYAERWVHQQQIRDAVHRPGLCEARWVRPLLDTFAHALPVALESHQAPPGTRVSVVAIGEGGGRWDVVRADRWRLDVEHDPASATLTVDVETLWRLYTKQVDPAVVETRAAITGDSELARRLLSVVAIIARRDREPR